MVDARRARRLLNRVTDDLAYLEARRSDERATLRSDAERLAGLKYVFVTAIEGCINLALHLCASEGWGPPDSNADAMSVLHRHDVLPEALATSIAEAVRFRNVLVHGYATVDDDLVVTYLDRLGDIEGYVDTVTAWVAEHE